MRPEDIYRDCKKIDTGLPLPKGGILLDGVKGQLSDGMWENSPRMEGYWKFFCVGKSNYGSAEIAISNSAAIWTPYYGKVTHNSFYGKTPREILEWFARKIYEVCKAEEVDWPQSGFKLKKGNDCPSAYLGGHPHALTGNDIWELRRKLLAVAKTLPST